MKKKLFVVWVTKACNLKCTYCYEKDKENLNMSQQTAIDVVMYILKMLEKENIRECDIHFHGGEPLLAFDIIKFLVLEFEKIKNCRFKYSITTNGTLLNKKNGDFLSKYFSTISVSIDGKKECHDSQRKTIDCKGTYDIVLERIKWVKLKSNIRIRMTVNTKNVYYLCENIIHLLKLPTPISVMNLEKSIL